jgi:hypothetical protein
MFITNEDQFTKLGEFAISPTRKAFGELCVSGPDSYLYIGDSNNLDIDLSKSNITGSLHDLTKVTLIDCIVGEGTGSTHKNGENFNYIRLFPHFVITGTKYLLFGEDNIQSISFTIEDASALFHDFHAFGSSTSNKELLSDILKTKKYLIDVPIGEFPVIAYFTGKDEILSAKTVLGDIKVTHNPSCNSGNSNGVQICNLITIVIKPSSIINFDEAINHTLDLLRFFDLIIGKRQKLSQLRINVKDELGASIDLNVYWSLSPAHRNKSTRNKREVNSHDLMINPITQSKEFTEVLINWLRVNDERRDARCRFSDSFELDSFYSIDRLISAANMFDILPKSASPKDVDLSADLADAKDKCKAIFKALPKSLERDSVLNAFGRIGKSSLKHKVRHRAKYIIDAESEKFSDLNLILDEAINCRNHYVHGTESKIDYNKNSFLLSFFTDSLEFVFAASELIEGGWNIKSWMNKPTSMSHPFGFYSGYYDDQLAEFKKLLPST